MMLALILRTSLQHLNTYRKNTRFRLWYRGAMCMCQAFILVLCVLITLIQIGTSFSAKNITWRILINQYPLMTYPSLLSPLCDFCSTIYFMSFALECLVGKARLIFLPPFILNKIFFCKKIITSDLSLIPQRNCLITCFKAM